MAGNDEWSPEENAYCLIELAHWHSIQSRNMKDDFLKNVLKNKYFKARNMNGLEEHFDYLYELVTGTVKNLDKIPEKDRHLISIYL